MPSVSAVNPDAVLLVQLSDSHLFADPDATLLGMNTRESLQRVVELVRARQPAIDLYREIRRGFLALLQGDPFLRMLHGIWVREIIAHLVPDMDIIRQS